MFNSPILAHCFAGCSIEAICSSLGIQLKDLFPSTFSQPIKTEYIYHDEHGKELYKKVRIEPGINCKKKTFYCSHTDEEGQIIKNLKGRRRVLYQLPKILKAIALGATIFLVEGEKDADKLWELGLTATPATSFLAR